MKEQLVLFETAKLAKEKGFNIKCDLFYNGKDHPAMVYNISVAESLGSNPQYNRYILVPTQSLLQKWLRKVHNIHVTITNHESRKEYFENHYFYLIDYELLDSLDKNLKPKYLFKTYEEALEQGLYESLKLIK